MEKQKHRTLTFVVPDVDAFQSGGNIYNKNLVCGLQEIGCNPTILDWERFCQLSLTKLKGYYFFDTLYFKELTTLFKNKTPNCLFFLIVHHLESLYPPKNWNGSTYFEQNERPFLQQFDGFLTSSFFTANYLKRKQLAQPKIVIEPAIDFQASPPYSIYTTNINALIVANLVERKGIFPFLKALAKVGDTLKVSPTFTIRIHLVGTANIEPAYANKCLRLIQSNAFLNKIIQYHGQLPPTQVHSLYKNANLFISTSLMETYGMALQEARAFQLPILALKCGNVENHVDNLVNGWLLDDMDGLIKQLSRLMEQPNLLKDMQSAIITHQNTSFYTWKETAKRFLQALELSIPSA